MINVWKGIGLLLTAVLAFGVVHIAGPERVKADSLLGPTDNETFMNSQSTACDNNNNGGIMEKTSEYVLLEVDCWHHLGVCDVCGDGADYSCANSPGQTCWFSPCPFTDPVPAGKRVTRIVTEVRQVRCATDTSIVVYINNTLIGSGTADGFCGCGTCYPLTVSSKPYAGGFPGYVYGGTNRLGLQVTGESCVSDVHVKLYYEDAPSPQIQVGGGSAPATGASSLSGLPASAPVQMSNIVVQSASVLSATAAPGQEVNVSASVANKGTANGDAKITLYINGEEVESRGVAVASGQTAPVNFQVSRSEPGTYTVSVGNVPAGSFTVDAFANNDILIYGIIALFALGIAGAMYFILRKRRA